MDEYAIERYVIDIYTPDRYTRKIYYREIHHRTVIPADTIYMYLLGETSPRPTGECPFFWCYRHAARLAKPFCLWSCLAPTEHAQVNRQAAIPSGKTLFKLPRTSWYSGVSLRFFFLATQEYKKSSFAPQPGSSKRCTPCWWWQWLLLGWLQFLLLCSAWLRVSSLLGNWARHSALAWGPTTSGPSLLS